MAYSAKLMSRTLGQDGTFFRTDRSDPKYTLSTADLDRSVGAAGTFNFTVPPNNAQYNRFDAFATDEKFITVMRDNNEEHPLFYGRVTKVSNNFDLTKNVYCEGSLSFLNDSVARPSIFCSGYSKYSENSTYAVNSVVIHDDAFYKCITAVTQAEEWDSEKWVQVNIYYTLTSLVTALLNSHNAQVEDAKKIFLGTLELPSFQVTIRDIMDYMSTYEAFEWIKNEVGGFFQIRYVVNDDPLTFEAPAKLYFDWFEDNSGYCQQEVNFGENLLNITYEDGDTEFATGLLPISTDADGNQIDIKTVNSGSDILLAGSSILNKYGKIIKFYESDIALTPAELKTEAQKELNFRLNRTYYINVDAVDLVAARIDVGNANAEPFEPGFMTPIKSAPHSIDDMFICNRIRNNLVDPSNDEFEFGKKIDRRR